MNLKHTMLEYLNKILPMLGSILIGIIITLGVQYVSEQKQSRVARYNLTYHISVLQMGLEDQVNSWNQLANLIHESWDKPIHIGATTSVFENVFFPTEDKMLSAFAAGSRNKQDSIRKSITQVCSGLRSIRGILTSFPDDVQEYETMRDEYIKEWDLTIKKISRSYINYMHAYIKNHNTKVITKSNDPFIYAFNKSYRNWQDADHTTNILVCMDRLIDPMLNICLNHIGDKRAVDLYHEFQHCRQIKMVMESEAHGFGNHINELNSELIRNRAILDDFLKKGI